MEFITVEQARNLDGLRIAVNPFTPTPWVLAARFIFDAIDVPYHLVSVPAGDPEDELYAWSGQSSTPLVAFNDERMLSTPEQIIWLAERLSADDFSLIPSLPDDRVEMFGLLRELTGENGFGWCRRMGVLSFAAQMKQTTATTNIINRYGPDTSALTVEQAEDRILEIMKLLHDKLQTQQYKNQAFYFGDQITAIDFYSACFFAVMLNPYPDSQFPMDPMLRGGWEMASPALAAAVESLPLLFEHRDQVFDQYTTFPVAT